MAFSRISRVLRRLLNAPSGAIDTAQKYMLSLGMYPAGSGSLPPVVHGDLTVAWASPSLECEFAEVEYTFQFDSPDLAFEWQ